MIAFLLRNSQARPNFPRSTESCEEDNDGIVEENDDEGNANHSKSIDDIKTMPGREGNYALTQSILQKYESRPSAFINMSLAQFATIYDVFSGKLSKKTEIVENISKEVSSMVISRTDEYLPKFIKLKDEKCTVMKLRSTPKILRRHRMKMSHEQVYSDILLFLPFTNK